MAAQTTRPMHQQFASDNWAGACPQAMDALMRANAAGHEPAYGEDRWTKQAADRLRQLFACDAEIFFVLNGAAANALALAAMARPHHSVICHQTAHIETGECGAPEFFSGGSKLLAASGDDEKLTPDALEDLATKRSDIHYPKPKAVSVSQATELGGIYQPGELNAISEAARRHHLKVHMDGARFANAVAALDAHPADISWRVGVDVLTFGGARNGLPMGEAVIFFNKSLAEDFAWRARQAGQLCPKMRFVSAPWLGLLENDVWLRNARHANDMAALLERRISEIDGVTLVFPRQSNGVFFRASAATVCHMHGLGWKFYGFFNKSQRLMCAWDTDPATVDHFAEDLAKAVKQA